jgi:hypothetical protein
LILRKPNRRAGAKNAARRNAAAINNKRGGDSMRTTSKLSIKAALFAGVTMAAGPVLAAEVTLDRLINADKELQNWLMNHRTYDAQRFSPLEAHAIFE